jgi:chorismate--pyruvate lyase
MHLPVDRSLRKWLYMPGSLTLQLRRHGMFSVSLLRQGPAALWPQERSILGRSNGYVREVILCVDCTPAVWARSAISIESSCGPWRSVRNLGTRPLAELLFGVRQRHRQSISVSRVGKSSAQKIYVNRQWDRFSGGHTPSPVWSRTSTFQHAGQSLCLTEAFAPWLSELEA